MPTGQRPEPRGGQLLRLLERLVEGGDHQILERLDVVRIDGVGVDRDRLDLLMAGHDDGDHAATDARLDGLGAELFLDLGEASLHLLHLLAQIARVSTHHGGDLLRTTYEREVPPIVPGERTAARRLRGRSSPSVIPRNVEISRFRPGEREIPRLRSQARSARDDRSLLLVGEALQRTTEVAQIPRPG